MTPRWVTRSFISDRPYGSEPVKLYFADEVEALLEAMELYKQASYQGHSSHWDSTMQHGAGCPECIRARELREQAEAILAQHAVRREEE